MSFTQLITFSRLWLPESAASAVSSLYESRLLQTYLTARQTKRVDSKFLSSYPVLITIIASVYLLSTIASETDVLSKPLLVPVTL